MNSIRNIAKLNEVELQNVTPSNASWHTDYRDTAYVYIGGLPFELSEGDVLTIFSQYGTPTHINLMRDRETGKSRGFAFLKYADQKSTDLAVDNLSGAQVLGRTLSVDHTRYKLKEGERETVGDDEEDRDESDREVHSRRKRRRASEIESASEEERPMVKEEIELAKLLREHDEDDPMKAYLIERKKAEVEEALKAVSISRPSRQDRDDSTKKHRHGHRHRHREDEREDGRGNNGRNGHSSSHRKHGTLDGREVKKATSRRSRTPDAADRDARRKSYKDSRSGSGSEDEHRDQAANARRRRNREDSSQISESEERRKR